MWLMFSVRSVVGLMFLITLLRSLGFAAGRLPVRLVWRARSPRRAPRLVLMEKVRWLRLRSTRHGRFVLGLGMRQILWVFRKRNPSKLASIRGKRAQVVDACVPIELALRPDGIQKICEVLDAYFGVDDCEGLLRLVKGLMADAVVSSCWSTLWLWLKLWGGFGSKVWLWGGFSSKVW